MEDKTTVQKSKAAVSKDKLKEVIELSLLYDFYGELLGEHKKQIFEAYILDDLSLSEIADEAGISRQGVYDIIRRCSRLLREYEDKLQLAKTFVETRRQIEQIETLVNQIPDALHSKEVQEILLITQSLLNHI